MTTNYSLNQTIKLEHSVKVEQPITIEHVPEAWGVMLPPCIICGGKSSGCHYGANTCESCKTFFRRSFARTNPYKCHKGGNCIIVHSKRHCSACRLQKCARIGMSKEAIKSGRYTLEKRNRDIEEVKKLELQARIKQDGGTQLEEDRVKQRDKMIEDLTLAFLKHSSLRRGYVAEALKREKSFLEDKAITNEIFGTMKSIPRDEYDKIYRSTGIDVDNRRALIANIMMSSCNGLISFLYFCNVIPGYKEMLISDRNALARKSLWDCYILLFHWHYNLEDGTCIHPMSEDLIFSKEDARCLTSEADGHDHLWKMMQRVQKLDLTLEEKVVSAALCLMNADAHMTRDGQMIADACTEYLLEALDHLCKRNHEPEESTLAKILVIIMDCRQPVFRAFLGELKKLFVEHFTQDEFIEAGCLPLVEWVYGNSGLKKYRKDSSSDN